MKIVFIILMHKSPEQAKRLIERLDSPESIFVVHVDRRASHEIFQSMKELAAKHERIYFAPRHRCYWGGSGIAAATLECVRTSLALDETFDYAILLSGQDYPIKPLSRIFEFLRDGLGKQFIEIISTGSPQPLEHARWCLSTGEQNHMVHCGNS